MSIEVTVRILKKELGKTHEGRLSTFGLQSSPSLKLLPYILQGPRDFID